MKMLPSFAAPHDGTLTADMLTALEETGVIILRGFAEANACANMRDDTVRLVEREAPDTPEAIFSTTSNVQFRDDYFEKSAANISFFFEEEAGSVNTKEKTARLNKICLLYTSPSPRDS